MSDQDERRSVLKANKGVSSKFWQPKPQSSRDGNGWKNGELPVVIIFPFIVFPVFFLSEPVFIVEGQRVHLAHSGTSF